MTDQLKDPNVFETANAGFAQAVYEEYLRDPASVGPEWQRLFESGRIGERPPAPPGGGSGSGNGRAAVAPASPDGKVPANATLIKGPAARLVQNMNESLTV